ncbi:hypothetical protein [Schleiferilactobacillus perolens]|uniref:Uncharacterized protein n=1 Tax=Schleiferilactobacillus perolens DSM 12744 TaxID=1423792 RepID=A0A0R1N1V9_9LACO|nr:hypothetical protein [Schleiferilactobacillus perolens]KRL11370.1 hypothetical protein FD09_GL000740 [Schleiferilactobacillus perolens DSM 12744]
MSDEEPAVELHNPTLESITCPQCGSTNFEIIGQSGGLRRLTTGMFFGNAGNIIRGVQAIQVRPLKAKCADCKHKFIVQPVEAPPEELLDAPATLVITRKKSIIGMAVNMSLMLNGAFVATLKNGDTVTGQTRNKHNYIQLFDQSGVGSARFDRIEMTPDQKIEMVLKMKGRY